MRLRDPRPLLIALFGLAVMACDGTSDPDEPGAPAHLEIVSGDLQTATVGTELPQALVVEVTDEEGRPVPGHIVNFVVATGGGHLFAGGAQQTGADGRAQERWTLGTTARDTQRVEVRAIDPATGQALVFAAFRAVGTPGAPAALVKVSGDAQTGAPGVALADSLRVRLTDVYGNGISGQTVAFAAAGGGTVSPATASTDASGVARAAWTLGTHLGTPQTVAATAASLPAAGFTATQVASGTLTRTGGVTQTGTVGTTLADSLEVRFTTPSGAPIQGAVIQWAGPGVLSATTTTTGADGYARTAWRLPTASGTYQVTANLSGASEMLAFAATANPGAPAAVAKAGGDAQTGDPGTALADPLAVRVTDAYGNPVPGVAVAFSAGGEGSVSPAGAVTGADGTGRAQWTLGTDLRLAQTASAAVAGFAPIGFTATSTGRGVLTLVSGNAQTDTVQAYLADSLVVKYTTPSGAPIRGARINWRGAGTPSPQYFTTGASGMARTQWRLFTRSGTYTPTASVEGHTISAAFTVTALPVAPRKLTLFLVTPGVAPINTVRTVTVRVMDRLDNPLQGVPVHWAVECGGPISPATSTTNADGFASAQWLINQSCGFDPAGTATVTGLAPLRFEAVVR
jgi:hypothetical protein